MVFGTGSGNKTLLHEVLKNDLGYSQLKLVFMVIFLMDTINPRLFFFAY